MRITYPALLAATVAGFTLSGCAASPRQQPIPTTRINTGEQTVQEARRVLDGRWSLLSLEVATSDDRRATVNASGLLTSDAFGNMSIEYKISPEGLKALEGIGIREPDPVISTTGRVVIDTQKRLITYLAPDANKRAFDPELAARRNNPFALERPRHYALGDDGVLTLTTRYDDGKDAATSRWRKN